MKFLIIIVSLIVFSMPGYATDWVKINDNWELDYDRLSYSSDTVTVWERVDLRDRNEKTTDGKKIAFVVYCDIYSKNELKYLTVRELKYDENGHIITDTMYPFGEEFLDIPPDSLLEIIQGHVIQGKMYMKNLKDIMEMGILRYK